MDKSALTIENIKEFNAETGKSYDSAKLKLGNNILSIEEINKVSASLNAGAKLEISFDDLNEESAKAIVSNLKLTGFVNVNHDKDNKQIVCAKKAWNKKTAKTEKTEELEENGKDKENPWKVLKVEQKADLVYEDELVDPFDNYQKFAKESDCITKPKPCKNCNCGRADAEKKEDESAVKDFKPSCGKCYMGDAFRCAGCPYRGMPAFNPGDKIQFNNTSDLTNENSENGTVKIKGDKVKIEL